MKAQDRLRLHFLDLVPVTTCLVFSDSRDWFDNGLVGRYRSSSISYNNEGLESITSILNGQDRICPQRVWNNFEYSHLHNYRIWNWSFWFLFALIWLKIQILELCRWLYMEVVKEFAQLWCSNTCHWCRVCFIETCCNNTNMCFLDGNMWMCFCVRGWKPRIELVRVNDVYGVRHLAIELSWQSKFEIRS